MKMIIRLVVVAVCLGAAGIASAFIRENMERNDTGCEKSMRKVILTHGKSDEIIQTSPNSISVLYKKKRLHFNFETVGNSCRVTSSDF